MYTRIISCFVAAAMIITSAGMPVMANTLSTDVVKDYEVLTDNDEISSDDWEPEISDNEFLEETEKAFFVHEETIDNFSSNDGNNEEKIAAIENATKAATSANDLDNLDEQMGLPIDILDEGNKDRVGNNKYTGGEGQPGSESENYYIAGADISSEETQSTDSYGIKTTDNTIKINASGIYHNWDGISNVTQFKDPNGGMYYAINSDTTVKIGKVEAGVPVSEIIILEKKHPLFGTAICDSNGNFYLITGEENKTGDTSVETIFISKYDSSGNFIATVGDNGSSSLASYYNSSFYTKIPFSGGNCDAAISGDILTVNYARKMYSDHQSNSVFSVNIRDMSKVSVGTFYESHSFAQRVVPVGAGFVYVSEGDCYDRSFTIYNVKKTNDGFTGTETGIFDFWVKDGALDEYNMYVVNENFAHMGGLTALTDGRVAFAAQSARSLNSDASDEKEDIFIQIFDPSKNLSTADAFITEGIRSGLAGPNGRDEVINYGVKWLTSLTGSENISNVQIVSTSKDKIVVFYEYKKDNNYKGVYYIVLDKDGNVIRPATVFDAKAMLNPCEMPVYTDGMICWVGNKYNESGNKIYAYSLELASDKEDIAGGTYADVTWRIDSDGVLTVTGEGDYENQPPWITYSESILAANVTLSQVTNLKDMFYGCSNLETIDLSGLSTSNVTDMTRMFGGCNQLRTLDVSSFNTSNVTNMEGMFNECSNLITIDLSGFDVLKVTNMSAMFGNCSSLKSIKSPQNLKCNIELPEGNWTNRTTGEDSVSKISENTAAGTLFVSDGYVDAEGVEINKTELILEKNEIQVLTAHVLPDNATNRNVKWSSNKNDIATVDAKGKVTAVSAGEAIITVTSEDGDFTDRCMVTVLNKKRADVVITESNPVNKSYGDSNFTLNANANNQGTGIGVWSWESSDERVATVSDEGVVTIKGVGESIIKAHFESDTTEGEAVITINVAAKTLGITWNNTDFLYDGASHKPTATITGVILGDDCIVTVLGEQSEAGTYTATAALSGTSSDNYILPENQRVCSFTIGKINVSNLTITGISDPAFLQKGDKIQLGVRVTPANATDRNVIWSSSNPEVVAVD
ncbi:MAG: Ig-like domain-containing protein, partial [Lachnospiraceae bacterium]|nr:Ig-like domain-containing protein [Lachnospiraceae bacterium]